MHEDRLAEIQHRVTKQRVTFNDVTDLIQALRDERAKVAELQKEIDRITILRPIEDLHEDHGEVLLWNLEIGDPPIVNCYLDSEFDESEYTHFSLIPNVKEEGE